MYHSTNEPVTFSRDCPAVLIPAGDGVVPLGLGPRAPVPDDDVPAAVLTGGDHALEVEVVQGVVLDVNRQPTASGS